MTKFILGTKEGMTQMYTEDGVLTAVTLVKVDPNVVVQVKTAERDGYDAVQIGTGTKKRLSKALRGHMKEHGSFAHLREFSADGTELKVGDKIDASVFEVGDTVKVSGASKGKGFAGVVKRHHFKGALASHGHKKVLRRPGSIGQRFPQHTLKGLRMAGRMGNERVSVRGQKVMAVDAKEGIIAIKGGVPGTRGRLLEITSQ